MIDGDTAWLLISAGLVMLMTPGLALFYGGMVQGKNVLSTFMHSFFALGLVTVQFAVIGYSISFGPTWHGVIGKLDFVGLQNIDVTTAHGSVPTLAFFAYQCMFAVIAPALISGAYAERFKFSAYVLFTLGWTTLVYDPIAHWSWADGGWLAKMGAITVGISVLINGMQTPGVKGFMEQLLGSGAIGWALGGPAGAAATITLDVL